MIINPDNPTGMVYSRETLQQIVAIAKEFGLFIISDEVYNNVVYNGEKTVPISDVIGDVPAISLKGISKEFPWPGSRCGWIEVYNGQADEQFRKYINLILTSKMNEVCSTTLPQTVIPAIMQHPQYLVYLKDRINLYEKSSNITYNLLKEVPGLLVNRTNGAFYMAVAFKEGVLNSSQSLPIANDEVRSLVESLVNSLACLRTNVLCITPWQQPVSARYRFHLLPPACKASGLLCLSGTLPRPSGFIRRWPAR